MLLRIYLSVACCRWLPVPLLNTSNRVPKRQSCDLPTPSSDAVQIHRSSQTPYSILACMPNRTPQYVQVEESETPQAKAWPSSPNSIPHVSRKELFLLPYSHPSSGLPAQENRDHGIILFVNDRSKYVCWYRPTMATTPDRKPREPSGDPVSTTAVTRSLIVPLN